MRPKQQEKETTMLEIITKLETDRCYAISVMNADNYAFVDKNLIGSKMVDDYGSVEGYFQHLIDQNITEIVIHPKRTNGKNAFVPAGENQKFSIGSKPEIPNQSTVETENVEKPVKNYHETKPEPPKQTHNIPVPTGLNGSFGLGFTDMMNLYVNSNDKARLEVENNFLKGENERLKTDLEKLKEEKLKNKYDNSKSEGTKDFVLSLAGVIKDIIPTVIPSAAPGLNAPAQQPLNQSPEITFLSSLEPEFLRFLTGVGHMALTNEQFCKELFELKKTHENVTENNSGNNTGI
ncbi:hypothetical protein [Flavobacterium sp. CAU 1735]|uniref:hypothetical protein n=1 Tax=Flavobacterium sp. CAU 1735 TaxID=3140361 RepID=UPI00326002FA